MRPSVVLERTDAFAQELERRGMATMLYAVLDPEAGTLRFASAGHPPPLILTPAGEAIFAEGRPGSPLGTVTFPSYEESVVALEPGSVVLLYTDGLVERPTVPLSEGLEALAEGAAGMHDPGELCRALPARVLEGRSGDDIALLAIRLEPMPSDRISLSLPAESRSLATLRRVLGRWLKAAGAGETEIYEALVAVGEACANAIAHAYPAGDASFEVEARRLGPELEVTVRDFGTLAPSARRGAPPWADPDGAADGAGHDRQGRGRHDRRPAPVAGGAQGVRDRLSEIEFEEHDGVLVARIAGEVDGSNAVELGRALGERLPSSAHGLVLDLSSVAYLDSAGIELLFSLARRLGDRRQRLRLGVPAAFPRAARARDLRHLERRPDRRLGRGRGRGAQRPRAEPQRDRVAAAQEARKPSRACSAEAPRSGEPEPISSRQPAGQRLKEELLLAPGGPAGPDRQPEHADQAVAVQQRGDDHRPGLGAGGLEDLSAALEGGAAQGPFAQGDRVRQLAAAARALDHLSQGQPVVVGQVDPAGVDVPEREQPVHDHLEGSRQLGRGRGSGVAEARGAGGGGAGAVRSGSSSWAVISWRRRASTTACERVEAPSFAIALRMWVRTVSGESTSCSAIWAPLRPSARSSKTWRSRFESGPLRTRLARRVHDVFPLCSLLPHRSNPRLPRA